MPLSEFADRLHEMMPLVLRSFMRQQKKTPKGCEVTPPQMLILDFLNKQGPARMSEVAKYMGVTTAAATGIVDRMVRAGYLVRAFEPGDRRVIKVKLTSSGARLIKEALRQRRRFIEQVFGRLSEDDRQSYLNILGKIKDILSKT